MKSRSTLFGQYFKAIIITILIPMIICAVITYIVCLRYTRIDVARSLQGTLDTSVSTVERILQNARAQVAQLALVLEDDDLIKKPHQTTEEKMFSLAQLRKKLESVCGTNPSLATVAVHLLGDDKILCQRGYYDLEDYFDLPAWQYLNAQQTSSGIFLSNAAGNYQVLVSSCVPLLRTQNATVIYAAIPISVFETQLSAISYGTQFVLADGEGSVVYQHGGEPLADAEEYRIVENGKEKDGYYCASGNLLGTQWYLLLLQPKSIAETGMEWLRMLLWTLGTVTLGSSLLCALLLASRFYAPIRRLTDQVRRRAANTDLGETLPSRNELVYLDRAIRDFSEYNLSLRQALVSNRIRAVGSMLRHLILGNRIAPDEMDEMMENYEFQFASCYAMLLIDMRRDAYEKLSDETLTRYLMETVARSAFELPKEAQLFAIRIKSAKTCVVFEMCKDREDQIREQCGQYYLRLNAEMMDCVHSVGFCGMGSAEELPRMYRNASSTVIRSEGGVYTAQTDRADTLSAVVSGRELKSFIRGLYGKDTEEITAETDAWIEQCLKYGDGGAAMLRETCMQLIGGALSILSENDRTEEPCEFFPLIAGINNLEDFAGTLRQFGNWMTRSIASSSNQSMPKLLVSALEYVNQNYAQDISLTNVADYLDITPQYLSTLFHRAGEATFTEHLNRLRLDKACHLLRNTRETLDVVSRNVGYNSAQYFIKKFKSAYGITPAQYRSVEN